MKNSNLTIWSLVAISCSITLEPRNSTKTHLDSSEVPFSYSLISSRHGPRTGNTAALLLHGADTQRKHVSRVRLRVHRWVTSTERGADDKKKLSLLLLLRSLATDCLPRICFRGNLFTNLLPSNVCTCNSIIRNLYLPLVNNTFNNLFVIPEMGVVYNN
jgi:hypothetical protein